MKKTIVGFVAVGAVGLLPVARCAHRKLREYSGEMAVQCRQMPAAQGRARGGAVGSA